MNWKARNTVFFSGTRNGFPIIVISTSLSYGRNISDSIAVADFDIALPPRMKLNHPEGIGNDNRVEACSKFQWQKYAEARSPLGYMEGAMRSYVCMALDGSRMMIV